MMPLYNRPSPGASGLTKPASQPGRSKAQRFAPGPAQRSSVVPYPTKSFAGRPLSGPARQPNKRGKR